MNIKPLFDKVIIKPNLESNKLENGFTINSDVNEVPKKGVVVACGDNLSVNVGDLVMYGKYSANLFKHDGEDYIIMRESDIFATINV